MTAQAPKPKDVDAYIRQTDAAAQPLLESVRLLIKAAVPGVEEGISYGVPFYKLHGQLAGFAAYKGHVSFGVAAPLRHEDREALEASGYVTGKKTVQIRFDQTVPDAALRKILRAAVALNEEKARP